MQKARSFLIDDFKNLSYQFLILEGTFGTGKTYILKETISQLIQTEQNYIVLYFDLKDCQHFHQIFNSLSYFTNLEGVEHLAEEINFFLKKYLELINNLGKKNPQLAQILIDSYKSRDYFETEYLGEVPFLTLPNLTETINSYYEKNAEKRILLRLFDVISEAIIFSLYHIVLHNKISEKPKVLFVFDNYERSAGIIDHWILNHLYKYLEYKIFGNFDAYEIPETIKKNKVTHSLDFKFILTTRYHFTSKKLYNSISEEKVKIFLIKAYDEEEVSELLEKHHLELDIKEAFSKTFGIPFALDYYIQKINFKNNDVSLKEYYEFVANKIFERINPKFIETLKFISTFNFFTEETIRCLPENYLHYKKIFKYLSNNKDIVKKREFPPESFEIFPSYNFFIVNYLREVEIDKFKTYSEISSKFEQIFNTFKKLNTSERKVFRSLAYFKEFDLGETLQIIFQEDYSKVVNFVKTYPHLFEQKNSIFSIPETTRYKLIEFNKLVDNINFQDKIVFINNVAKEIHEKHTNLIDTIKHQMEKNQEKITKIQISKSKIKNEIQELQKSIVSSENYLIDLNSQKYNISRKHIWVPFLLLVIASLLIFLIGNNILFIFSEAINIESIKGLGTALKIFSVLLFGIFLFMLVDLLSSKERKEAIKRTEEFIREEEEKLLELKECLNDYKGALKQFELEFSELLKENEKIENELNKSKQILEIHYIDTT